MDFRDYPKTGKQATRMVDYLDWNRDDQVELLLQVFSRTESWFEVVSRGSTGTWRNVMTARCAGSERSTPVALDSTTVSPRDSGAVSGSRPGG